MSILSSLKGPDDLRSLPEETLPALAEEIRERLISSVCRTGGHLGPNLGVVELTIAMHRVFESPRDAIVWDTGHQAYVHKMLTGRADRMDDLRQAGGMSGYPQRSESEHDLVENSHASTSLSYVDGLAKAFAITGQTDRVAVAVIGDGAMTGGMCWEALNNIAAAPQRPVVIVLNDNGRSYAPTIGAFGAHLADLRASSGISVFEQLGMAYLGPVDGHDLAALEAMLHKARDLGTPTVVHCVTRKGLGYAPAEADQAEKMHTIGPAGGASKPHVDRRVLGRDARARRRTRRHRGAQRGHARPDRAAAVRGPLPRAHLRRRHRRAARRHVGGRSGDGRPAPGRLRLRDLPQPRVRPAADGRRAAPPAGDVRARPGRHHRHRRAVPPRHVGPDAARHRARAPRRRTPRRRPVAALAA